MSAQYGAYEVDGLGLPGGLANFEPDQIRPSRARISEAFGTLPIPYCGTWVWIVRSEGSCSRVGAAGDAYALAVQSTP